MLPVAPYPPYYCPPGVKPPAHCPWLRVPRQLVEGLGPDGKGGRYFGGGDPSREPWEAFKQSREGWYVRLAGFEPKHLVKPRTLAGETVEGVKATHHWLVPQLCEWHPKMQLVSALPDVFRDYQWRAPLEYERLIEQLRAFFLLGRDAAGAAVDDEQARDLAIDLLSINHVVSIHELSLEGWLDRPMVGRVLEAAGGLTAALRQIEQIVAAGAAPIDGIGEA